MKAEGQSRVTARANWAPWLVAGLSGKCPRTGPHTQCPTGVHRKGAHYTF